MRLLTTSYVTAYKRKKQYETAPIVIDLDAVVALIPHGETVEVCLGNTTDSFRSLEPLGWWLYKVERYRR